MDTYAVLASKVQVWLLQVPGTRPWWQLIRPGVVVATEAAVADVQVLEPLLWEAFISPLGPLGSVDPPIVCPGSGRRERLG